MERFGESGQGFVEILILDLSRRALFLLKTRVCLKFFVNDCRPESRISSICVLFLASASLPIQIDPLDLNTTRRVGT